MQMPQIRMQSQFAQIQIQTTPARQEISQPRAELTIKQPPAEINIHTKPGRLEIDQSKAWEDMNLMGILRRSEKFAQEGMAKVQEGTARRARQGSELMKIENGGNPLSSQAMANAYDGMKSLGIKFIPSHFSVNINYEPAKVNIDVKTNKPVIQATPHKPEYQYHPGSVETTLKQKQQLEIEFVNLKV